jgi:hypothetical protein
VQRRFLWGLEHGEGARVVYVASLSYVGPPLRLPSNVHHLGERAGKLAHSNLGSALFFRSKSLCGALLSPRLHPPPGGSSACAWQASVSHVRRCIPSMSHASCAPLLAPPPLRPSATRSSYPPTHTAPPTCKTRYIILVPSLLPYTLCVRLLPGPPASGWPHTSASPTHPLPTHPPSSLHAPHRPLTHSVAVTRTAACLPV